MLERNTFGLKFMLTSLLQGYLWIPTRLVPITKLVEIMFNFYRKQQMKYPTYDVFDFAVEKNGLQNSHLNRVSGAGIVIQGAIREEFDFSYRILDYYLQVFDNVQIVLSTWDGEELKKFRELESKHLNFHIIAQQIPSEPGISNINLQILSTLAGLKKLEELGVQFAIKTRTDQCMFDPFAIIKLKHLFSSESSNENGVQKIIVLSLGTFLFRPYGVSDFFQFGSIRDLLTYWDVPLDYRKIVDLGIDGWDFTLRQWSSEECIEVYLAAHYLRAKGERLDFSLGSSLLMFKSHFIVVDPAFIELIWDKRTYKSNRWKQTSFPKLHQELTHGLWLTLDQNMNRLSELDYLLDIKLGESDFSSEIDKNVN